MLKWEECYLVSIAKEILVKQAEDTVQQAQAALLKLQMEHRNATHAYWDAYQEHLKVLQSKERDA